MLTNSDYLHGYHEAWEREIHRAEESAPSAPLERLRWRQTQAENAVRKLKGHAADVVLCEVCQERAASAILDGRDLFDEGIGVREQLENFGIFLNKTPKRNQRPLVEFRNIS